MMTLDHFELCLDRYGSDLGRWPAEAADEASALLDTSEAARSLHQDALSLDDALNAYEVAPPSAALEAALLDLALPPASASAAKQQAGRKRGLFDWFDLRIASTAAAGVFCAAVGFVIGLQSIDTIQTQTDAEAFLMASSSSLSADFWSGDSL